MNGLIRVHNCVGLEEGIMIRMIRISKEDNNKKVRKEGTKMFAYKKLE